VKDQVKDGSPPPKGGFQALGKEPKGNQRHDDIGNGVRDEDVPLE
jgi:hypothetical protein